jgi:hypothetical protein
VPRSDDTLHEVTEVAVIRHRDLGVLLLHSDDRRWHFPDATVRAGRPWDDSLREAVLDSAGVRDLTIGPVLSIRNFGPGEVDERAQFGIFFLCATDEPDPVQGSRRWISDVEQLEGLELFHPLVADLIRSALRTNVDPTPSIG